MKDSLKGAGQKIKNFLGFSSPTKEGPGREADKWAPNFMEMFRKGIVQGLPGIRASVSSIADEMAGLASMTVQPAVQATASVGYMADSGMMSGRNCPSGIPGNHRCFSGLLRHILDRVVMTIRSLCSKSTIPYWQGCSCRPLSEKASVRGLIL